MNVTRNPTAEDYLIRKWYDETSDNRENQWPGTTTLIYCLTKAYYQRTFLPQRPSRQTSMMFATGLWLEKVILGKDQNPTAGELDGIFFHTDSVDDLDWEDGKILTEVKSTRKSMRTGPKGQKRDQRFDEMNAAWVRQFKGYLKVEGLTRGRAVVLHLMGDYGPPFPDVRIWDIECTQNEIDENWIWLQGRKFILDKSIADSIPPAPYTWRVVDWDDNSNPSDDYECNGCAYAMLCEGRSKGLS